jgi:glycosyltransferase involved in cell wall biosynthesis
VPRVIEAGANGLLVSPDREGELSAALERLIGEEALRHRLARAGRETIEARYSFAARMDKVRSLYEELLKPLAARHRPTL